MRKVACFLYFLLSLIAFSSCDKSTKVQSVYLSPDNLVLNIGETFQLEMFIQPISAVAYSATAWTSSNTDVAVVDSKGVVTAVYSGECMIIGYAADVSDTCFVKVITPSYNFAFDRITMYDVEDDDDKREIVLRLHDSSLSFDKTGNASGNGTFLSIHLFTPISSDSLPLGDYNVSDNEMQYTVAPGEINEENGQFFVTGSFLGQYTDNGLGVICVNRGSVSVSFDAVYHVDCDLSGSDNEKIEAECTAFPLYFRNGNDISARSIYYQNYKLEDFTLQSEPLVNHKKLTLDCEGDTSVVFVARVPLSVDFLPIGEYLMNSDASRTFTLLSAKNEFCCSLLTADTVCRMNNATLYVTQDENEKCLFEASFLTDKESFVIHPKVNVTKTRLYSLDNRFVMINEK